MKNHDRLTSIVWAVLGLYFAFEGYRLDIGTLAQPGCGLFVFGAGIILSSLGVVLLIQTFYSKSEKKALWEGLQLSKGIKLMVALFVYTLVFRRIGFVLSTFFLLLFLFKALEPQKLRLALLYTSISVSFCYLVFGVFLEFHFPGGVLEEIINFLH